MTTVAEAVAETFDLRGLVREVLANEQCDSPREYAERVLDRIPEAFYRAALGVTLTEYVRHVNRAATETPQIQRAAEALRNPGGHASKKVAGIAHMWSQLLARKIPSATGGYLPLADASAEQVKFYAGMLNVQAARTKAAADAYLELADLMRAHRVSRVRDLPAHVGSPVAQKAMAA